jgi:hypothetical protein
MSLFNAASRRRYSAPPTSRPRDRNTSCGWKYSVGDVWSPRSTASFNWPTAHKIKSRSWIVAMPCVWFADTRHHWEPSALVHSIGWTRFRLDNDTMGSDIDSRSSRVGTSPTKA